MKVKYLSLNEFLIWDVFNRSCMYAHQAVQEWDKLLDAPDKFLVLCSFGDFITAKSEEYWLDFAISN
jgi:hypothetical protein